MKPTPKNLGGEISSALKARELANALDRLSGVLDAMSQAHMKTAAVLAKLLPLVADEDKQDAQAAIFASIKAGLILSENRAR
jgi:hypothetical protein